MVAPPDPFCNGNLSLCSSPVITTIFILQRKCIKLNSLFLIFQMSKNIIGTSSAPSPIGPYSQAVLTGNPEKSGQVMLFISGQVCIDPATGNLKNKDIQEETHQV